MAFPLLRLPLELRRQIYACLLVQPSHHDTFTASLSYESYECEQHDDGVSGSENVVHFRHTKTIPCASNRTRHKIRSGRLRSGLEDATYLCINKAPKWVAILRANRQVHVEAVSVLYGAYVFDFGTHIEGCVPFLTDLTSVSRQSIRQMSIVKRALPYEKDFDRCEWANMCRFLATRMSLAQLSLGVITGKQNNLHTFAVFLLAANDMRQGLRSESPIVG